MIEPDYITDEPHAAANEAYHEMEDCVRRNPGASLLATIVTGIALGLLVRALWPEPKPQHRVLRLLDEIEDRLRDLSGPPLRRASGVASDSLSAIGRGLRQGEAGLEKRVRNVSKRIGNLFS
ncbi:MAG TPA: hypothetical protein VFG14_04645 [Chthoniobacteraceae bacterium]|jgi:hypothetical protein|nr:hypothetical protein [Chthoniobacteraceae bacterium]